MGRGVAAVLLALATGQGGPVLAAPPEYLVNQKPVPASVEEEPSPMESAYDVEALPPGFFPGLRKRLEDAPPFWRDSHFYVRPRSYYFDRRRENTDDSVAAAYGGWLSFRSGAWLDRISIDATLFTTQKAYGPSDKDGTLLLGEGQEGFWVLGSGRGESGRPADREPVGQGVPAVIQSALSQP